MTEPVVHPTAIVAEGATLGRGVRIGPYSMVGKNVVLGDNVELVSHAVIDGNTTIGAGSRIFPFASIGHEPQDLKYHGENSCLEIGERCTIREAVTINPGTEGGGMLTKVGNDCLIMANAHVAHDAIIGNNVVMANYVGIAGHVHVGDNVIFGGTCVIHQFTRIGSHAFIGAQSMVDGDVIPYGMAVGNRAVLTGLNLVGLKRRKFDREAIHRLRAAYRQIFASEGTLRERVEDAAALFKDDALVQDVVQFIADGGDRPILLPKNGHESDR
ncbi:acyl-ACP--UDP-N-acetylglucosamine O-acyltransferase [Devosia sp. 63-57]|uniref:acyl-ACP--UDP-N-acetylglucosamine O-acyltransferase n=1 Tax=Devosia sp. 63-57 TaxID=1895751 RepID=UPI00086DD91C|nr:acyl-ACP--UDP-N-acetylglucosamine O-acyltransferase [Devosia sp. 63-57]ODT50212.1 MAG: acyl-[acyl-carrier-protein]--UDP-N-acetylglucosamine O-acyltransferase [Pelagibacterium sp. SCN 63-126]ODU84640.1 MAG: acyl-[acyl-carrier-protein]--UDP-N-acetylglucosamine O-acyltransferase [Pelagibacterium sp. SCN 63-17]OJX44956.1 MAG: acyl-[acyl-carrier-protein]--UDP-N-acetylglucosamine O-acyltransferase [Devosia sp. 63-57]